MYDGRVVCLELRHDFDLPFETTLSLTSVFEFCTEQFILGPELEISCPIVKGICHAAVIIIGVIGYA